MVVYFSKNGTTKKFAKALAEVKKDKIFEIEQVKPMGGNISNAIKSVLKKETDVKQIPNTKEENVIYLCSPVWGGGFPPAMRYFVRHGSLKNKRIVLLLTCMTISNGYVKDFEKQLSEVGAKLDKHILFSSKQAPEDFMDKLSVL